LYKETACHESRTPHSQQGNLIEPPVVIDLRKLFTGLSENEQGIIKRRLIENRKPFGKVLQRLVRQAKQETGTLDMPESLKQLEEKEDKEISSHVGWAKSFKCNGFLIKKVHPRCPPYLALFLILQILKF